MNYRKWSVAILLLLLALQLVLPAQAMQDQHLFDEVGILTTEEHVQIENLAGDISLEYGCGIYMAVVWDYNEYGSTVRAAAENYFLAQNLGLGSDDNGVLLFLSMADRDYALIAHGALGNAAFTDYGKDVLSEAFLENFRYDDWSGGFMSYVITGGSFLEQASTGKPVESNVGLTLVMILLIPAVIAGISCAVMAASMKTARIKTEADDYRGQVQITGSRDQYLTRTVVRQKIETNSSSRSGGTTVNSGGFSGKSGKF